jgi:putative membrane protein
MARSRFPKSVYGEGSEPDPRFTLANERTFLAWLRTALALLAAAIGLEALQLPDERGLRIICVALFLLLSLGAALQAWRGWTAAERSMRRNEPLPGFGVGSGFVAAIALTIMVLTIGLLV